MGLAAVGVAMIAFEALLWGSVARTMRRQARPTGAAWRRFYQSPGSWFGFFCIAAAVNPTAGAVVLGAIAVLLVIQIVRGVRDFPAVWRLIGDPDAWRGGRPNR